MPLSKAKSPKIKSTLSPSGLLAAQALREAQRSAIKEDLRYGLKPVLVRKKAIARKASPAR